MSRQTFGCECFLNNSASRLASSRAALSAQRISLITTNSRVDLSRHNKALPNAPAPSWSTTVNWSIYERVARSGGGGQPVCGGKRCSARARWGSLLAGTRRRRGTDGSQRCCESPLRVLGRALVVAGRQRAVVHAAGPPRCATRTKNPQTPSQKAHITPPGCTSTPRPACRSPRPSLQDSPAAPRPSDGRRRDSAQPRPCPTPPSSPGPATSLTT